jgi:hypothetical protein
MSSTLASLDALDRYKSLEWEQKSSYAAAKDDKICYYFRGVARMPAVSQDPVSILDSW